MSKIRVKGLLVSNHLSLYSFMLVSLLSAIGLLDCATTQVGRYHS